MRWIFASLSLAVFCGAAVASDVAFVRVWPQWRNADAFDRIKEYFGGGENDGREMVVRTHAEQRAGLYFLVRVKTAAALPNAKFALEIIRPDSPDPKTFTFPASIPPKGGVVELGLTDGDWPGGREAHPVAWKITLQDNSGRAVASEQSFLWEKPAK